VEAGDHVIVIGKVLVFDHTAANPLGYWKGNYVSALLEYRATDASLRKGHVGAILEHDGKILLVENKVDAHLHLPLSIGSIKALSTDVNFQNHLQYSVNRLLISQMPATLTMPPEFFRHF
jgi:hypothetical protein